VNRCTAGRHGRRLDAEARVLRYSSTAASKNPLEAKRRAVLLSRGFQRIRIALRLSLPNARWVLSTPLLAAYQGLLERIEEASLLIFCHCAFTVTQAITHDSCIFLVLYRVLV
jgi:hypothetical protein